MKKQWTKKELQDYVQFLWEEITGIVSCIRFYQIVYDEDYNNFHGGALSVIFNPFVKDVELRVYKSIYDEVPDKGLTDGFKIWLARNLAHEAGHCIIWELHSRYGENEKVATEIGLIILELLKKKGIVRKR